MRLISKPLEFPFCRAPTTPLLSDLSGCKVQTHMLCKPEEMSVWMQSSTATVLPQPMCRSLESQPSLNSHASHQLLMKSPMPQKVDVSMKIEVSDWGGGQIIQRPKKGSHSWVSHQLMSSWRAFVMVWDVKGAVRAPVGCPKKPYCSPISMTGFIPMVPSGDSVAT